MGTSPQKATYKDAGVDLEVYRESMSRLPSLIARTQRKEVVPLEGGFAGMFQLFGQKKWNDPLLVSCTDGVGTKLKVATMTGKHSTVGIDLVAMSVNDAICCGAEPLFFLDYVAMGKDDPGLLEEIVRGITDGLVDANCALLGGETAIMPDIYAPGDYDLAGFAVAAVERDAVIDGKKITPGDVVVGLASSGFHSNGYSLVRKVVFEMAGLSVEDEVPELGTTVGDALLTPTRIYVKPVLALIEALGENVHGLAHITGGGLVENISRLFTDENLSVEIDWAAWDIPPVFLWVQELGNIEEAEMREVFNLGLGMTIILPEANLDELKTALQPFNLEHYVVGRIV